MSILALTEGHTIIRFGFSMLLLKDKTRWHQCTHIPRGKEYAVQYIIFSRHITETLHMKCCHPHKNKNSSQIFLSVKAVYCFSFVLAYFHCQYKQAMTYPTELYRMRISYIEMSTNQVPSAIIYSTVANKQIVFFNIFYRYQWRQQY